MKNSIYIALALLAFVFSQPIGVPSFMMGLLFFVLMAVIIFYPKLIMKPFAATSLGIRVYFVYLISMFTVLGIAYLGKFNSLSSFREIIAGIMLFLLLVLILARYKFKNQATKKELVSTLLRHTYVFSGCLIPFIILNH